MWKRNNLKFTSESKAFGLNLYNKNEDIKGVTCTKLITNIAHIAQYFLHIHISVREY